MTNINLTFTKILVLLRWAVFIFLVSRIMGGSQAENPFIVIDGKILLLIIGIYYIAATLLAFVYEKPAKNLLLVILDFVAAGTVLAQQGSTTMLLFFALPILEASRINAGFGLGSTLFATFFYVVMTAVTAPQKVTGRLLSSEFIYALVLLLFIFLVGYLYDVLKRQERQTRALLSMIEATQELGASSSLEKVMEVVINMVNALFRPGTAVLYLLDDENPDEPILRVKAYATPVPDAFTDFNPKVANSLVGQVVIQRKPVMLEDYNQYDKEDIIPKNKALRTVLITPMMFEGRALGALYIAHHAAGAYSEENMGLLAMLANQVALAIRNVQLQQHALTLAIKDSLSGAYTHGYFQEHLGESVTKAKYANQSLSMMILDVDFFKKVNDSYGHPQGDALLRQLYGVIQSVVRPSDVVCRYGGDEFTVTMLNTNRIGGVMIAERIREAVEEYEIVLGSQIVHITISGGVASYPEDADVKKQLVEKSDAALYEAKHKGRNKICFAAE